MLDGRLRTRVSQGLAPLGRGLERARISANLLTVVGLALSVLTAFLIGVGALGWAVLGLIASGLVDLLDGTVARRSGQASPRGAFFDSVTDRVSDAVVLGGVAWYLAGESPYLSLLAFTAAALSMLVSYERARAEGLGYDARGGLMERAERMVLLGIGLAFDVLVPILWLMIALTALTAIQRFIKVWRQASDLPPRPRFLQARHRRVAGTAADGTDRSSKLARWRSQRGPDAARRDAAREARRQARAARRSRP
jgi:CDP-diacylglycerol--glycerol-3-phosphate 3-phosphatidyltransferase